MHVRMSNGHSLERTLMICSVSFFCFPIFSVIIESESLSKPTSFLLSYFRDLIFSRRFLSRSLMSLDRSVERFSIIELWLGAGQAPVPKPEY